MKKTYDLAFGVGNACSATQTLREAGLQFGSFPFDWVIYSAEDDLDARTEALRTDFAHWFDKDDLVFAGYFDFGWHARDIYRNRRTGVVFNHDFNRGEDFEAAYDGVAAKYARRAERLFGRIRNSKRVLAFRLDRPDQKAATSAESCVRLKDMLEKKFPGVSVDVLLMAHDPAVPFESPRESRLADGILKVSFDYHSDDPRAASYQPDIAKTAAVLSRYVSAVDYRTFAEKWKFWAARRRAKKRAHWAKYGADSALGYRLEKWRRGWLLNVLPSMLWARFRRRKFSQIVPLGINCEVAFRFYVSWGFVDSSLFAWSQTFGLRTMCETLRKLDRLFAGEATLDAGAKMWKCEETGTYFHGQLKWGPGHPDYTDGQVAADLEDLRGRVRHLREKFLDHLRNETSTLLVHRLAEGDAQKDDLDARLSELESVLGGLGARNCTLLIVVERKFLDRMPAGVGRVFRAVRKFNPCDRVTDVNAGDPIGWRAVYSEFAPSKILPKKHAFKFE